MDGTKMGTSRLRSVLAEVIGWILLPRMVAEPSRRERIYNGWSEMPVRNGGDKPIGVMARTGRESDIYLVSTSWAWGTPRVTNEREATGPPQAA